MSEQPAADAVQPDLEAGPGLEATLGRIAAALERIAAALEAGGRIAPGQPASDPAIETARAAVHAALAAGEWEQAGTLLDALSAQAPVDPAVAQLRQDVERSRTQAVGVLRERLDASLGVNDPEAALSLHGQLASLLEDAPRRALDREVVRWSMGLIQRRMRAGTVRTDVALFASQVAERFDHLPEGASLRAALPVLRRSAGLCARCAEPYQGVEDACPRCLPGRLQIVGEPGTEADETLDTPPEPGDEPLVPTS